MLDVPRELVLELAGLLRAERRARGTRKGTRLLTCFRQALLVLVWMRTKGEVEVIGAGFGVPRATAYRYRDEALAVLAAQAADLHEALQEVAEQGWSHVVVDGKLIRTDRCAETTISVKGETINAWYSGKHRAPGGWLCQPELAPGFSCDPAPLVVGGRWGVLLGVGPSRCCGSWVWTWSAAARAVSAICRICWL